MLKRSAYIEIQHQTMQLLDKANIALSDDESENIEVADFGLNQLKIQGLQLITYINNEHYCAKELILFPKQTCPEHKHPSIGAFKGKTETFRCRFGKVFLYVDGPDSGAVKATIPKASKEYYTVFHEIEMNPGDQYTILPDTLHWFQADDEGAVVSEFSTTSYDEFDLFSDPNVDRMPKIVD